MKVSIIISSYNYGRFLAAAIDSALNQTYPDKEVIVVDDGSRDNSVEVMTSYGSRIQSLAKKNGGQGSAFNAGVKLSSGEVIVFLDSDDLLFPESIANMVPFFEDPEVVKVHWNLSVADENGKMDATVVRPTLSEGDQREAVLRAGPDGYDWPPTSGNAWKRSFVDVAFPIPEKEFDTCPDIYLAALAPLYGQIRKIDEPQGFWRHHPFNASFIDQFGDNLRAGLRRAECYLQTIVQHAEKLGLTCDIAEMRTNSRWHQMDLAVTTMTSLIPEGDTLILADQDHWKTSGQVFGRPALPFIEHEGQYWGCPADDEQAIRELERMRDLGARWIVFVWPYLWWLQHYAAFNDYLRTEYRLAKEDARIVIFDLRRS
ncbi:MAG TPA: glycosyltransferase family 2 protein [Chthoniobacteraceae bacterium]|jgi:hypothetical protein